MFQPKDVFISYKSDEFDYANWVRVSLENNGITCWMAPMSISGGASYASEIPQAIRTCKAFVLILSSQAQLSRWVPRELDQAINDGKTILPFMIENCELKDDFKFYLTNVQRYNAYQNKIDALKRMIVEIKNIIGPVSQPDATPVPAENPEVKTSVVKQERIKSAQKSIDKSPIIKFAGIGAGALVAICVIIGVVSLVLSGKSTSIAGTDIKKDATYISLIDKDLSMDDISAIADMKELTNVALSGCTIPENGLSKIVKSNLQTLSLENCGITDDMLDSVDFSDCENLWSISIQNNEEVTSIASFSAINDNVKSLNISGTGIDDLGSVADMTGLTDLFAGNLGIDDISALENCKSLTNVYLNDNNITSLESFSEHTELKVVDVSSNELESLEGLENSLLLDSISAKDNSLSGLDGLENATKLRYVNFNSNSISDFSVLGKSSATLQYVYIDNNNTYDISFVADASELMYFSFNDNSVDEIQSLENCTKLRGLSAANNDIESIEAVKGFAKQLTYLNLASNFVEDISPLKSISPENNAYIVIDVSNNNITELALATGEKIHYTYLGIYGNDIVDYSVLNSVNGSALVMDYSDSVDYAEIADSEIYDICIIGCPKDKQVSVSETLGTYKTSFVDDDDDIDDVAAVTPEVMQGILN